MSESNSLVTWTQPQALGKLEGSDWMQRPECYSRSPKEPYHLEGLEYPEGYIAAYAVSSLTGEMQMAPRYSYSFRPPCFCRRSEFHAAPSYEVMRSQQPVDIGHGRVIENVRNPDPARPLTVSGPGTHVRPRRQSSSPMFTRAIIDPPGGMLFVEAQDTTDSGLRQHAQFRQGITKSEPSASFMVGVGEERSAVHIELQADGTIASMRITNGNEILRTIGMGSLSHLMARRGPDIVVKAEQADIAQAVADRIGLAGWGRVDLHASARKLYGALGQPVIDLSGILTMRP